MLNKIIDEIKDKDVAIVGFGLEGISTYKFIRKYLPLKHLTIIDKNINLKENELVKNDSNLDFILGENYLDNLDIYDIIIKSPGVKFKDVNITSIKKKITSQLEFVLKYYKKNTIGITASKGKSTTTSLIYRILTDQNKDARLLGNIGIPLFDEIEYFNNDTILVIEMAALQLEFVDYSPHIGLILNLYEEHLDFFKTKNDYYLSKMNMFKYQSSDDYGLYLSSNDTLNNYISNNNYKCNLIDISLFKIIDNYVVNNGKKLYNTLDQRLLIGNHNLINIMFALQVSELLKLDLNKTISSINRFKPLEHRLELVGVYNDITYYNDSIATIPAATINAIEGLKRVNTLIVGGMDRGIDYSVLIDYLKNSSIENFICMPTTGYKIGKELEGNNKNIYYIELLTDAVKKAKQVTKKNTICLLSPSAVSYEYFKNYIEKGNLFKKLVKDDTFK